MANEDLSCVSRSLHATMDAIIGNEMIINIRRTTTNLGDDITNMIIKLWDSDREMCYSGSRAEGLRFKSSDDDWMYIYRKIKVIPSKSYMARYDSNTALLLMENEMTKPGFTLLRPMGGRIDFSNESDHFAHLVVLSSLEYILNGHYLSCKRWREEHTATSLGSDRQFTHGPCASGIMGDFEYDLAFCMRCDIWPTNAQNCIKRLNQSAWPSHDTVLSIINDGVLFVPIGAKQSVFENTEWRMSFSLAEKKLIHAMNHTQFLCYGLLKIFLKEAIDVNPDLKGLLCSYFLKTALFWEITTTFYQWNPSSLLSCFWKCFHRLLQWISCSYCPNFFIPQNNMFQGKIEGTNRDKLLQHLRILYCEGYRCLLRCPSLSHDVSLILHRPNVALFKVQPSNNLIAMQIINEYYKNLDPALRCVRDTKRAILMTGVLMHQLASATDSHKRFLLKTWLCQNLTSFCVTEPNYTGRHNRSHYRNLTAKMNILERCRIDSASHFLYQAMLSCNCGRYNQALRLMQHSTEKILAPETMGPDYYTEKQYRQAGGDKLPIETMTRRHFVFYFWIDNDQHIPELYIELHGGNDPFVTGIKIHPLVCVFLLQYLCQRKLGKVKEANEALWALLFFLEFGQITEGCGISWQILGVCQQLKGDDDAACQSYLTALRQDDNRYRKNTCMRLGTLLVKYFRPF